MQNHLSPGQRTFFIIFIAFALKTFRNQFTSIAFFTTYGATKQYSIPVIDICKVFLSIFLIFYEQILIFVAITRHTVEGISNRIPI